MSCLKSNLALGGQVTYTCLRHENVCCDELAGPGKRRARVLQKKMCAPHYITPYPSLLILSYLLQRSFCVPHFPLFHNLYELGSVAKHARRQYADRHQRRSIAD
jgi:hypothetical protein